MRRGELYRVYKATTRDPRRYRVFVVVSRQILLDSRLSTQVSVGVDEGLKHESSIHYSCLNLAEGHAAPWP